MNVGSRFVRNGQFIISKSVSEASYSSKCICQTWGHRKKLLEGRNGFDGCVHSPNARVPQAGPFPAICIRSRFIRPCYVKSSFSRLPEVPVLYLV